MRYLTIGLAITAWIVLGLLIGHQSSQEMPPQTWSLVQRYALAVFALVATLMASKYTTRP
jgi:hypothetical protein